jgi:hypothetical protein
MLKYFCLHGCVFLVTACLCHSAGAAKAKIPLPRLKPASLNVIPKPRLKPQQLQDAVAAPKQQIVFPRNSPGFGWSTIAVEAARKQCETRLKGLNIIYAPMASFGRENSCGAPAAIKVEQIAGVKVTPPAEMTCDLAEAVHGWVSSSVAPQAQTLLKKRLVKINNASAYVCRRRNNSLSGKLSEHAKANALDISTLGFEDGSSINIKGDWSGLKQLIGISAQGSFLRQVRRDACIRFTTVLGPGSDPYHGDHFHVDVARRKNGYRICS